MAASLFFLNSDAKILDLIRAGNDEGLVMLYEANRKPVRAYVTRNNGTSDDAEDLLQEAVIILWERVRANRFEYSSRLSTFIYATVKNLWFRRLARMRRESPADTETQLMGTDDTSSLEIMIESEEATIVHQALQALGDPCKTLLLLFYWQEKTMEEIAAALNFANAETAKAKKYQCKKALEKLLKGKL